MSILPTQIQGSTSSSSLESPSLNHNNPNHGSPPQSRSPFSLQSQPQPQPQPQPQDFSGSSASVTEDSAGSSTQVNALGAPNGSWAHQDAHTNSLSRSGGGGVGSVLSKGNMSGNAALSQSQQSTGSINSRGGSTHSSGRRAQMTNANHLLNFHYDPIARPQPRGPPPRRPQKKRPYSKDLFLQANYKFIVLDTGNYAPESMDPDKMLKWEDIICVRFAATFPVQCPICLEYPLCPQITSCGHIFCFPCILRYLLMGEEDHKGDCFKRCPLCFVMISPKDLYTIYIENVKQYCIGETIEFMLLTRQKDSFVPSKKINPEADTVLCCKDNIDPFSKFTFTSDVELSVRKAISDLDSWLARADSGLVDDLEKLPYVCAAMEQLEKRKKYWNEHKACHDDRFNVTNSQKGSQGLLSTLTTTKVEHKACSSRSATPSIDIDNKNEGSDNVMGDVVESLEDLNGALSSSYEENKNFQRRSNVYRDVKDKESYNFYQAIDGQHLILHPLNMKCLLQHYGSYDLLPDRVSGTILQLETVTQSEAIRRRYRYLSHFSLTTTFQLCEIDLNAVLPPNALLAFMDEIKKREKLRKQIAKKEQKEKIKAEAAASASIPTLPSFGQSSYGTSPNFSMEDFEALGISSSPMSSSPPVTGERILFSNVARLGFAAGHDSPSLKIEETVPLQNNQPANDSSSLNGSRNSGPSSFASITSRAKSEENLDAPKMNEVSKKGKKPNRVLLSTTSGRRY